MTPETKDYEDTRHLLPRFRGARAAGEKPWIRGVFEGGGAKGVAYLGAIEAVEEHGCWFEAAAGASAGAITAALIAAGYSPREMKTPMLQLLELLQWPGIFKAVNGLRKNGEIFRREAFREKLDELLRRKESLFDVEWGDDELTFRMLHDATGVDLYVVAADVSRCEPVVFHHRYTPDCQVADAIVASSSIPFAFDGGMLTAEGSILHPGSGRKAGIRVFRTIVDGGVWTNFPMFVFKDAVFREYMAEVLDLDPEADEPSASPVVGFVLHELVNNQGGTKDADARRRLAGAAYAGVQFERVTPLGYRLAPIEQTIPRVRRGDRPALSPRPGEQWRYEPDAPRWTNPRKEPYRTMVYVANNSLGFASMSWVVALMILGVIIVEGFLWVVIGPFVRDGLRAGWTGGGWELAVGSVMAGLLIGLYVAQLLAVVILFLGALVANWSLFLPARRVLHGLVRTLVATPGTTPWEHLHPDVIALEIPKYITTLKVPSETRIKTVREKAKATTKHELPKLLKRFASRQVSAP